MYVFFTLQLAKLRRLYSSMFDLMVCLIYLLLHTLSGLKCFFKQLGNDLRQPPRIFSPNERINKVRLGSSFTLECTARGNPLPSIRIETPNSQNIRKEISDIRDQVSAYKIIFKNKCLTMTKYKLFSNSIQVSDMK